MEPKLTLNSTGHEQVDRTLHGLVGIIESAFPGRIRGYHIEGSYADKTALISSDVDLIILFKDSFVDEAERERAEQIAHYYDYASQLELDIEFLEEEQIIASVPPSLKLGSRLLFGEAIPAELPLIPVAEWGRERMHAAYWLMTKVFGRPDVVTTPRDYPQPEAEFYGYAERVVRLPDGREARSTRDLIRVMGWAGTALVAVLGHQIVARKKACHVLYRQYINDEWASFFESIYQKCREEWHYLIPKSPDDRQELRLICQRALAFENHFLRIYKQFLLSELRNADPPSKLRALWVQQKIPYIDPEIIEVVRELSTSGDEELSQRAANVLRIVEAQARLSAEVSA